MGGHRPAVRLWQVRVEDEDVRGAVRTGARFACHVVPDLRVAGHGDLLGEIIGCGACTPLAVGVPRLKQ
ncbi:hypothetical protein GCM10009850_037090 [Nonomuraea monospora]|uniref:Uncharacterized protein n=1 Tax=Nonomuraea monospora TaxID=568818 RepID=A0ABN3CGJ8_9ACTN